MPVLVTRFVLIIAIFASGTSCSRESTPTTVPASTAYNDGFEVVVFDLRDGATTNARSIPLKDAERAIAAGAQALISGDPAVVQQQLSAGKSGDSRVSITVTPLEAGRVGLRPTIGR